MIRVEIPGFRLLEIHRVVSDYTGTLSFNDTIRQSVKDRLTQLAKQIEIHVVTSDTFRTAKTQLAGISIKRHELKTQQHDIEKASIIRQMDPRHVAAFGNGNNDWLMLRTVKMAGGLAVAVENGEGCALDAIINANLFVAGSENALDLLLEPKRCIATLRTAPDKKA